ncbi:Het-C-domain-containing protein [Meredithblackwellia eburnea MCA 4105]
MTRSFLVILLTLTIVLCLIQHAHAFGAGNIPSFSFLEGKAFRHGDIEDVLAEIAKRSGGLGSILGSNKFGGLDIKRIYFGNWLRDYSQAMDIAGLSKMPKQTIINLCMGLGFLAHGYATGEFEVTDERLGVYLCTEHIDNPKGYAADQPDGDARKFDPRLRPPVDPRELEIDPDTGMKNYISNEKGTWDTSSRLVRQRMIECIELGRRAKKSGNDKDLYECYRLLGTFLHTLEDFSAHSNWVELSLRRLGYKDVFCHVGDACIIQTPAGPAPPLVTGTFGGSDFIHSLLGEASDHISEASVSDLAKAMDGAKSRSMDGGNATADTLRDLLFKLPGSTGSELTREMNDVENIRTRAQQGDPATMSPQELHAQLWQVLTFRDNVVKGIERTIEKIPGLSSIVEKIVDSVNRFIFTTLEPLLKPVMGQATTALQLGSAQVINNEDQFEVFDKPNASDPTHSYLSKDHFNLILNEPAGKIATIILTHTVKAVVNAWEHDNVDPNQVASDVLTCFHHPYFFNTNSAVQRDMGAYVKSWIEGQKGDEKQYILNALTKQSVRDHKNKRRGHVEDQVGHGYHGSYNSILSPEKVSSFASQHIPGASGVIGTFNSASNAFGSASHTLGFREIDDQGQGQGQDQSGKFDSSEQSAGGGNAGFPGSQHHSGGGGRREDEGSYGSHPGPDYSAGPSGGFDHQGGGGGYNQSGSGGYGGGGPPQGHWGGPGGPPPHHGGPPGWQGGPPPPGGFDQQGGPPPFWQGQPPQGGGYQGGYNPGYGSQGY